MNLSSFFVTNVCFLIVLIVQMDGVVEDVQSADKVTSCMVFHSRRSGAVSTPASYS